MKIHKLKNSRAQFFIASAIIIVVTVTMVFHYVEKIEKVQTVDVEGKNSKVFFDTIVKGYGDVADGVLYEVSRNTSLNATEYFLNNLTEYTRDVDTLTSQKNMALDAGFSIVTASNSILNASVNITLHTDNADYTSDFYATASTINATPYNFTTWTCGDKNPTTCCAYDFFLNGVVSKSEDFVTYINTLRQSNCVYTENQTIPGLYTAVCQDVSCWLPGTIVGIEAHNPDGFASNNTCTNEPNNTQCSSNCYRGTSCGNPPNVCGIPPSGCGWTAPPIGPPLGP